MRMSWLSLVAVVLLGFLHVEVHSLPLNLFYPFGTENGDTTLAPGDEESSSEISLNEAILFFNTSFTKIYVNINGHVSFDSEVPGYRVDQGLPYGLHIIAVFLADIDTRAAGRIYYRSTEETDMLKRAAADVRNYFSGFESYVPSSLFIVTWDRVGYYDQQSDKLNTFQLILASDGYDSFAVFHYKDEGVQWMTSQGKFQIGDNYKDIPPQAGFEGGKGGNYYTLPGSGKSAAFTSGSNVNVPGVWIYHIGNVGRGNVRPADLNTGEVTLFELETAQDNCFQASDVCHSNAQCIDNDRGFCCMCVPPFYGNGLHCLEPGRPQRLNGRVSGTLNGVSLDNDLLMHTYVVTTDGRTYSAISRVPNSLGAAMQTLHSIGGIIGWLFAAPMNPKAKNGYSFTGGKFNRTARVTFQSPDRGDYVVRLYQTFMGHDSLNTIRMETRLEGNMPDIPLGASVSIDDYQENYKRTAPGTIKSFVARNYRVNDVVYRYTWDNTITFEECDSGQGPSSNDVMRLSVSRHYVKYSDQEQVVRFAMTSKVGLFAGADPCSNAAQNCDQHADCVPNGDSYKCVCRSGYSGDGVACQDIDECQMSPCDQNARCLNTAGSFQCRCLPGFSGDGRLCRADVRLCGDDVCDRNARCFFDDETRLPRCECNLGFRGDGVRCMAIEANCNEADICAENAECVYDDDLREYVCECMDEFSGDGYSCEPMNNGCGDCDRYARCVRDISRNMYTCQCNAGYTGDGRSCTLIDTCADCDRNARCHFNDETSDYECVCVRGYQGDGSTCELQDCREDREMCDPEGGICWFDEGRDIAICRCNYGYRGDGFNCKPTGCDVYDDCDENARCVNDGTRHVCQCDEGFVGDGKRCRPQSGGCDVYNDCDVNARCVPDSADPNRYVCRCNPGYQGDGKACSQSRIPCNQVNNCDRNADCIYDPDILSYTCRCARGYEGDGLMCMKKEIRDCRRDQRLCAPDAECVQGANEAYVCVCRPGFRGDGASCSPVVREGNYLIYAQGSKLMRISTNPMPGDYGQQIAYMPGMLAVGLDVDCAEGDIYWTDAARGIIRRSRLNGTGVETVFSGMKSPEGIAIDYVARNMFFTDSEMDCLKVARLDGSSMKTLVNTDMINPRAIVLDINRGTIYWTDWNRNRPQIEKMNMDGTDREVLVTDGLRLPNGLAFDTFSQTLCWGDAGTQSIECVRSDGAARRVVYDKAPYPFDITVLNNVIYWTDWQNRRSIPNINQNGGDLNEALSQAIGGHGRVYGITALRDQCPRVRNSCGLNNGGCKYLCLASDNGGRTCACPDNVDPRLCQQ